MKDFLRAALKAAEKRRGYCAPNPAVGAVVVKEGQVVATGTHWAAGHPHAEVDALHKAGEAAQGAALYVTLEPCSHHGRTPPCTDLIIQSGISQVVFAFCDPNPVASKGRDVLMAAGIACQHFPLPEIDQFYQSYAYWLEHHRPWVRLKLAISADHKIAGDDGAPINITGEACNQFTQDQRHRSDAILTTVQTIINDNPQLNVRLPGKTLAKPVFVIDSHLRLGYESQIFRTAKNLVVYHRDDVMARDDLQCVAIPYDQEGLNFSAILLDIAGHGVHDLWVEVGAKAFRSFYKERLANEIIFYRSKKQLGDQALPAFIDRNPLEEHALCWETLGEDEVARLTID